MTMKANIPIGYDRSHTEQVGDVVSSIDQARPRHCLDASWWSGSWKQTMIATLAYCPWSKVVVKQS
jgi:hypothetical protein